MDYAEAQKRYIKATVKGIMKVISKMGVSTMRSYHGAQIFEAIGLKRELVDTYFTLTASRIEGIGIDEIALENQMRHASAYAVNSPYTDTLEVGGHFQCKDDGEIHMYNPETIYLLQRACREGNYALFKEFSRKINGENVFTIRHLLDFNIASQDTLPIEEVEPIEAIVKKFKTGAMSYGSLSKEAHECIAIAMNRLGGKAIPVKAGKISTASKRIMEKIRIAPSNRSHREDSASRAII
jgi:glutamate synthase (NADPH/NADH) large chain